ncbi:conserved hypothetical protein [Leishmania mexicana MHOM/GT/2001/U1103]|uniref:Uncharacterized protein n=1 Tax=Leishmania mexicana (strain MHOM/GT/2001/U1103) TaxID=929439 RepID=E9AK66_LEIMU|nr:conserved hypothetical protein [Leishmania mexicana MHOM/GT/2001/U1103]CBZ23316.1 conserved hypothetical protein [Leishmania mexicana MHOM/GT/2001/U1103]
MLRNGSARARRNGAAVLLATGSTAINGHSSAGSSAVVVVAAAAEVGTPKAAAAPPLSSWDRKSSSRIFSEKPPAEESIDTADGAAPARKTPARQQLPPPSEAVVASPSPAAASLASLEADAMVRSWQQCIDPHMENLPSSLTSSVFRSGHSAAQGVPRPPAPPSMSASRPAHLSDAAEEASRTSSKVKRTSQAPSQRGAGEAHSKASEDGTEDSMNPARHRSAAASSVGVPATAGVAVATRQSPSVRSHTSSAMVGDARRSNASVRPDLGEEHGVPGSSASSMYQRLPTADPFDKESQSSSHCDSGALPPPPAFSSFASVPSVAVAMSVKTSGQQASQRAFCAASSSSSQSPAADAAATPKRARSSANPRSFSGSCGSALPPQRRDYQGNVTSRATASIGPFHLNTGSRSAVRRSMSPCCAPPGPLASVPAQERQRLVNLPHQLSTAPGTSRLDMSFEQDVKELYRQTHLVDPLLLSRPGRRQFYIPEQADLFGMYPEPPMTTDEDGNEIVKHLAPIPIQAQSFVPSQKRKSSQSPPMAPASSVQHGKAGGADATGGSHSNRAVVRPGRGLSSFVAGYGEETTAQGRGGLTQPRGRIVSDITAPYRRNMSANTGRTGHIQCESLMTNSPLPGSVRSLSPGMMAADGSLASTPFTIMRPTPFSEPSNDIPISDSEYDYAQLTTARMMSAAAPLHDQQHQQCVNAVLAFVEDEEYSYNLQSAAAMASSRPIVTVSAAVVVQSSLGGGAGGSSSSSHSEGISGPVKPTVAPPPTRVNANTGMELDAAPKLTGTPRSISSDGAAATERRSRPVRSGEGAGKAAEKVSRPPLVSASASLLTEAVTGTSSRHSSSAVGSAVAAGGPSELKKAPTDSRRSTGSLKSLPLQQQAEQQQTDESEAVATAASQSAAPTPKTAPSSVMDKSTHSLAFSVAASSTVVDPSPEPPIPTVRRHADPVSGSMSSLSELSLPSQRTRLERVQPTKETRVSPAAAAVSPSTSLDGTPPALPPPPQAKAAAAVCSEPDKPSAVHEGYVSALERYRRKEAAMSKDGDMRCMYRRSRCSESSATVEAVTEVPAATAAQGDTLVCSPPGLKPASAPSTTVSSLSSNTVGIVAAAAAGHSSRCREPPLVSDRGTQTEFVFVLDDLQGRRLQQLQQEQLLKSLQLMPSQLQRQPLLILNAGSYSPPTFTATSTPRMSLSPQPQTSGGTSPSMKPQQRSANLSPARQRRSYFVNDSRAVREALWWSK